MAYLSLRTLPLRYAITTFTVPICTLYNSIIRKSQITRHKHKYILINRFGSVKVFKIVTFRALLKWWYFIENISAWNITKYLLRLKKTITSSWNVATFPAQYFYDCMFAILNISKKNMSYFESVGMGMGRFRVLWFAGLYLVQYYVRVRIAKYVNQWF